MDGVGRQATSHFITLSLTQQVQLVEPATSKLQVIVDEIVLVERRTMNDARTQYLYSQTQQSANLYRHLNCTRVASWLSGTAFDLRFTGHGFNSQPVRFHVT